MAEEKTNGWTLAQLQTEPQAAGIVTDGKHAAELKSDLIDIVMGVPELFALLDDWQRRAHGYLIVVVRMGVPDPLSIYVAYGDHALRHQVTRAVRSMRGARTLWWRGLNQSEDAIVREVFNDTCQRVWAPGLDDLDVGGRA